MTGYRVAVIPGDGVGTEVAAEAVRVLEAAGSRFGFDLSTESYAWGCDWYLERGEMMPEDALETLAGFDAIFLGCIGDAAKVPDDVSLTMLLRIRTGFDQYVNLRPIRLYPGVSTPIETASPETVDMVVVRENTEGEYARLGGIFKAGSPDGFAIQTGVFTRKGCERVIRYAFDLARSRKKLGDGPEVGRVTNCTKSNALNYSMVFWDQVYSSVAADYPEVATDKALVDALTMWFVKKPEWFDVVVASNLFGDIITDLGSMLQGGMGLAAGGNIDPERRYPSMFEPIHGSAPKYTGQGRVNPIASIEAARMMLDHLGEHQAAEGVGSAISKVLAAGEVRTADLGGTSSTAEVGAAVAAEVG
ncbi:MAG: tartrate dehydrogenase [Actinobacteria bacterium RBG_16_68_21]|nr:MAG: tartrate dehydrogenase [Actinobacteria bacterium RBG_16_68_21]